MRKFSTKLLVTFCEKLGISDLIAEKLLAMGQSAEEAGNTNHALHCLQAVLNLKPNSKIVFFRMRDFLHDNASLSAAASFVETWVESNGYDFSLFPNMVNRYMVLNDLSKRLSGKQGCT